MMILIIHMNVYIVNVLRFNLLSIEFKCFILLNFVLFCQKASLLFVIANFFLHVHVNKNNSSVS